jgi:hypothetical protein
MNHRRRLSESSALIRAIIDVDLPITNFRVLKELGSFCQGFPTPFGLEPKFALDRDDSLRTRPDALVRQTAEYLERQ